MDNKIQVSLTIDCKKLPVMNVYNVKTEEVLRLAANEMNEEIVRFRNLAGNKTALNSQDFISMAALDLLTKKMLNNSNNDIKTFNKKVQNLIEYIDKYLIQQ